MPQQVLNMKQEVTVKLSVDDWAQIVAAVGMSGCTIKTKERVNSAIYDSVNRETGAS